MSLSPVCPTEMEFDLDKALEEVPIHVEDPPLPAPPQPLDRMSAYYGDLPPPPPSLDSKPVSLGELPPVEHVTLEHRTKCRPKPTKRTKPSRPPVGLHVALFYFSVCLLLWFRTNTNMSSSAINIMQKNICIVKNVRYWTWWLVDQNTIDRDGAVYSSVVVLLFSSVQITPKPKMRLNVIEFLFAVSVFGSFSGRPPAARRHKRWSRTASWESWTRAWRTSSPRK